MQGPSPDEVALVEGAAKLGFALTARTTSYLTLSFHGQVRPLFRQGGPDHARASGSAVASAPSAVVHRELAQGKRRCGEAVCTLKYI